MISTLNILKVSLGTVLDISRHLFIEVSLALCWTQHVFRCASISWIHVQDSQINVFEILSILSFFLSFFLSFSLSFVFLFLFFLHSFFFLCFVPFFSFMFLSFFLSFLSFFLSFFFLFSFSFLFFYIFFPFTLDLGSFYKYLPYNFFYKEIPCKFFPIKFIQDFPCKLIGDLQQKILQKNSL